MKEIEEILAGLRQRMAIESAIIEQVLPTIEKKNDFVGLLDKILLEEKKDVSEDLWLFITQCLFVYMGTEVLDTVEERRQNEI